MFSKLFKSGKGEGKKQKRTPKYYFRNFFKELKRVRWNAEKDLGSSFFTTLIFIIITSLTFVALASFSQSVFRILRFI